MKIGVIIDSFKKDFRSSVSEAAAIGADGVQIGSQFLVGDGAFKISVSEAKKILNDCGI